MASSPMDCSINECSEFKVDGDENATKSIDIRNCESSQWDIPIQPKPIDNMIRTDKILNSQSPMSTSEESRINISRMYEKNECTMCSDECEMKKSENKSQNSDIRPEIPHNFDSNPLKNKTEVVNNRNSDQIAAGAKCDSCGMHTQTRAECYKSSIPSARAMQQNETKSSVPLSTETERREREQEIDEITQNLIGNRTLEFNHEWFNHDYTVENEAQVGINIPDSFVLTHRSRLPSALAQRVKQSESPDIRKICIMALTLITIFIIFLTVKMMLHEEREKEARLTTAPPTATIEKLSHGR